MEDGRVEDGRMEDGREEEDGRWGDGKGRRGVCCLNQDFQDFKITQDKNVCITKNQAPAVRKVYRNSQNNKIQSTRGAKGV